MRAMESSPAAIRDASGGTVVPSSRSASPITLPTSKTSDRAPDWSASLRPTRDLDALTSSVPASFSSPSSPIKEPRMRLTAVADGWSNIRVEASQAPDQSFSRWTSSVAPSESSPADVSGASCTTRVPVSSEVNRIITSSRCLNRLLVTPELFHLSTGTLLATALPHQVHQTESSFLMSCEQTKPLRCTSHGHSSSRGSACNAKASPHQSPCKYLHPLALLPSGLT